MRVIVCENYQEMSKTAAKFVASQLMLKPDSVLGLATGSTPEGMYANLVEMYNNGEVSFKDVTSFNLDEYYPISPENVQSYRYFMNKHLFSKVDIDIAKTNVPNGSAADPAKECEEYEKRILQAGGVDLQILGIGKNGHIGFNEPEANLNSATHLTNLADSTIQANSRFFDSYDEVPKQALTMGIGSILRAKRIIILASGVSKHRVVSELLGGGINTDIPASMLKLHSEVILICDKDAYSSLRLGVDIGGTDIKFGILDENNKIIYSDSIPTVTSSEGELIDSVVNKCKDIMNSYPVIGVGLGVPGIVKNRLVTASNLPFKDTDVEKLVASKLNIPVEMSNDANCAALGEAICGVGKNAKNIVMLTLGTGIGGGIILDGKIYQGCGSAGEVGHMCIESGGVSCGCGKKGCWERYASVTALIGQAVSAAKQHPESTLAQMYEASGKLSGKLIFEAIGKQCPVAIDVFDKYLDYLAIGIRSIKAIFDPDMVILSGGITNAGDDFIKPLEKKIDNEIKVMISTLKSDAGVIGAAMM